MSMENHGEMISARKTDSSIRVLWQSYQQSSSSETGGPGEQNEFSITKYLCSYFEGIFNMPKNLTTWGRWLYALSNGRRAADFTVLKNLSPSARIKPPNLGSNCKRARHYNTVGDSHHG
jgi:hypothetical protein